MTPSTIEQMWQEARAVQAKGKLTLARKLFLKARKAAPKAPGLAIELGVLEAQMGLLKNAEATLQEAIRLAPQSSDAHYNLAEVYRANHKYGSAIASFQTVLRLAPDHAEAMFGLGNVLLELGKFAEATPLLEAAASRLKNDPEVQATYAEALMEGDEPRKGLAILNEVIKNHPDDLNANLVFLRGLFFHSRPSQLARHTRHMEQQFDMDKVLASYDVEDESAIRMLGLLGDCYQSAALPERAKQVAGLLYRRKSSRDEGALLNGILAVQDGDFDEAENWLKQVSGKKSHVISALYQLSMINRLTLEAEPTLQQVMSDTSPEARSMRMYAGMALYRLLSRNGRHSEAFAALAASRAIRAEDFPDTPDGANKSQDTNIQIFTPAFYATRGTEGFDGDGCVFIVGMMRSGTTLTEQILAAHPKVHAGGERDDMMTISESLRHDMTKVSDLPPDWARKIGQKLHEEMFKGANSASIATDKLPGNINNAGLIRFILPKAKFIFCHRTPQDCALSNFEQNFSNVMRASFDLKALAHKYALHEEIARYWIDVTKHDMFDLNYDAMVQDPEPHIRKMLNFIGLEFDEACLYPNEVKREIRTASVFQVRQPISAKSVGRWKRYETELEPFTVELEMWRKKRGIKPL